MPDANIVLKMVDQTREALQSAKTGATDLGKEFQELSAKAADLTKRQEDLRKNFANVSVEIAAAKKEVREAAKAFAESGSEADKANYSKAIEQYEKLSESAKGYRDELNKTRREIRDTNDELRKSADETQKTVDTQKEALSGWGAAMASLGQQLGGSLSGFANYAIRSSFNSDTGNIISSILGGAISGASIGLMTANPLGVGIGAVVGGISGLVQGVTANAEAEDDAFRAYSDALVSSANQNATSRLSSGSTIAARREQDAIAFATLLGSENAGASALDAIKNMANFTPYYYDDLVSVAKELTVYGYGTAGGGDLVGTMQTIGNAGAAIGWSTADQQTVAQQLGFLGELDSASAVQLKQLLRKGLDVYGWLSEDLGVDRSTLLTMVSSGEISGQQAVDTILVHMADQFGGSMEKQSQTYSGLESTIGGLTENLNAIMGESYNSTRISSMQEQVAWLSDSGMEDAYSIIGEARGILENRNEAINRDVFGAIFNGRDLSRDYSSEELSEIAKLRADYLAAAEGMESLDEKTREESGAQMEAIYQQTEALSLAMQDANASNDLWDEAALEVQSDTRHIVAVLEAYKDDWAYAQQSGRGRQAALAGSSMTGPIGYVGNDGRVYSYNPATTHHRATGQRVIPHDNYPILAHGGERLLSAAEVRAMDRTGGISVTGNTFIVRQESDIDAIAQALADRIERAAMLAV